MALSHGTFLKQTANGDFDLVFPRPHGGLDHYSRANSIAGQPWSGPGLITGSPTDLSGAALIESAIAGSVNLHVVYREGARLAHDWGRRPPEIWHGPTWLPGALTVTGAPSLIESAGMTVHVIAPVAGGVGYWKGAGRTEPEQPDLAFPPTVIDWQDPIVFGIPCDACAILLGSFDNLEAVLRAGSDIVHYWQDNATGQWHGPIPVMQGAAGQPCWFEGSGGNYELITPLTDGGLAHWFRDNRAEHFPWFETARFGEGQPDACAALESTWGSLEVAVQEQGRLFTYTRTADTAEWQGPFGLSPVPGDPAQVGATSVPFRAGIVGIHAALLRTGKVLLFGFGDDDMVQAEARVLDPETGALTTPAGAHHGTPHVFCSGHTFLSDGRLLVAGGHHLDIKAVNLFNPITLAWQHHSDMPESRWYPSCCAIAGGRVLIIGGTSGLGGTEQPVNNSIEIWSPTTGLSAPISVPNPFSAHFTSGPAVMDTYPIPLALPSGKVLVHSRIAARLFDPATQEWDALDLRQQHPFGRTYPGQGNGLLLPLLPGEGYRARVMLIGGAGEEYDRIWHGVPATNTCEILDLSDPTPAWRFTAPMSCTRVMCDSVLLPDATVLTAGGSARGCAVIGASPELRVELFDPDNETWRSLTPIQVPRMYHSTALLLPDGRVLLAGKDGPLNPFPFHYPEHRIEIYSPPYLFKGPRPRIMAAPSEAGYGGSMEIRTPDVDDIASVAFMRPGTTTHSVAMDQRYVGLAITGRAGDRLTVATPPDAHIAPEGYYMLFLVNAAGVPSVARFVRLR